MTYFAGIDGGGSSTRAVIASLDGKICAVGRAGPCNPHQFGPDSALASIQDVLAAAWKNAGMAPQPLAGVFLGLSGADLMANRPAFEQALTKLPVFSGTKISLDHDIRISLAGGLAGKPGIALIAGTGSSGFGLNAQGQSYRVGGWGGLLDDVGSGYWIAMQAMTACTRAADGRAPATTLIPIVLDFLGITHMNQISGHLVTKPLAKNETAALAPRVMAAAQAGDAAARRILENGTNELALIATTLAHKLFAGVIAPVIFTGGIASDPNYRDLFDHALKKHSLLLQLMPTSHAPVTGALLLAFSSVGETIPPSVCAQTDKLA